MFSLSEGGVRSVRIRTLVLSEGGMRHSVRSVRIRVSCLEARVVWVCIDCAHVVVGSDGFLR